MADTLGVRINAVGTTVVASFGGSGRAATVRQPVSSPRGGAPTAGSLASALTSALSLLPAEVPRASDLVIDIGPLLATVLAERGPLSKVTAVRISPSEVSIRQPTVGWPEHLVARVDGGRVHVRGGTDMAGDQPIPLDLRRLDEAVRLAERTGAEAFAIAATGALLNPEIEFQAADHLVRHGGGRPVILSHEIGGLRYIERECATILNASLLRPAADLFDLVLDSVRMSRPRSRRFFLLADGSCLGREEARTFPIRAVGTSSAAIAQGAAAVSGVDSAVILGWDRDRTHLMTLDDGCLRTSPLRQLPRLLPGLQLAQRNAARVTLDQNLVADAIAPDLENSDRPVILVHAIQARTDDVQAAADLDRFAVAVQELSNRFDGVTVIQQPADVLAAAGAAAARPQVEVLKFAVVADSQGLLDERRAARSLAQTRLLSIDPRTQPRLLVDQVAPLSFLERGPVLLRVHAAGDREGDR